MIQNSIIVDKFKLAEEFTEEAFEIANSILNKDNDEEDTGMIDDWDEYDRDVMNSKLDSMKPKKYKYELGQAQVLLNHTEMFYLILDRRAFTFLKYFTETYGE